MEDVVGYSFDGDGSLLNLKHNVACEAAEYAAHKSNQVCVLPSLVDSNLNFLQQLKLAQTQYKYTHSYTYIGSNRQSKFIDDSNALGNGNSMGSFFPAIQDICKYLESTFKPLLLADIFGHLPEGTSYARAMDKEYKDEHSDAPMDHSKGILIYAQVQNLALLHPHDKITFNFYDDRTDLLKLLIKYYQQNPFLIPHNVTVNFIRYDGGEPILKATIQGTGSINSEYQETVQDLFYQAESKRPSNGKVFVTESSKPLLIVNPDGTRKPNTALPHRPVSPAAPAYTLVSPSHSKQESPAPLPAPAPAPLATSGSKVRLLPVVTPPLERSSSRLAAPNSSLSAPPPKKKHKSPKTIKEPPQQVTEPVAPPKVIPEAPTEATEEPSCLKKYAVQLIVGATVLVAVGVVLTCLMCPAVLTSAASFLAFATVTPSAALIITTLTLVIATLTAAIGFWIHSFVTLGNEPAEAERKQVDDKTTATASNLGLFARSDNETEPLPDPVTPAASLGT